ncbi:hypothetical protein OAK82_02330 [Candidatus Thioglobus sp.]|nr:hypothetical protein [Candidatus Thioglobus sp.]
MFIVFLFLFLFLFFVIIEFVLRGIVRHFRNEFQWIITEEDDLPNFNKGALESFFNNSFDKELGWVRKPNTTGIELGKNGEIKYHIDSIGSRYSFKNGEPSISTFGDSYTFCRQVEDDQTWQSYLGKELNEHVLNFGVGNYGIDQALLYYKRMELLTTKIVILGFVPETICRIQSYWKHYLEFGNIFAFKPRFSLKNEKLLLHRCLSEGLKDLDNIHSTIKAVQKHDVFYKRKFKSLQFRGSYLLSYFNNFKRNTILLYLLIRRKIFNILKINNEFYENAPFAKIMKSNVQDAHMMYQDDYACNLLEKIILEFRDEAHRRNQKPIILLMPQLIDIQIMNESNSSPYRDFYRRLNEKIPVLDMTEHINYLSMDEIYIEDGYGGHFSEIGNKMVASQIAKFLNNVY